MRPVTKLQPRDTITLLDGTTHRIETSYKSYKDGYRDAKEPLAANIGEFCSYCERPVSDAALAVEHIQAKSIKKYAYLEFLWINFLLACARCNGKDNKSAKDVVLANVHLPHLNNTMLSIHYGQGGLVQINSNLIVGSPEYQRAKALIDLVGLDKLPGHPKYKHKDKRWFRRDSVWQLATDYESDYQQGDITIKAIINLALSRGFFSVWFAVFGNHPEVRQALIQNFAGTAANCFDPQNNYNPIPRNPPNI